MNRIAHILNALVVIIISLILYTTLSIEWKLHLLPCPFCYIQRLALLGIGTAELLNLRFGFRISHFLLCFASAFVGLAAAGWQITMNHGFKSFHATSVFALPLYTWSFIILLLLSCAIGILMVFRGHKRSPASLGILSIVAFISLFLATLGHIVGTYIQCGTTLC